MRCPIHLRTKEALRLPLLADEHPIPDQSLVSRQNHRLVADRELHLQLRINGQLAMLPGLLRPMIQRQALNRRKVVVSPDGQAVL